MLWSLALRAHIKNDLARFAAQGRPVLEICNSFQALVKADLFSLPGDSPFASRSISLTFNAAGRFECRWVAVNVFPPANFPRPSA